VGAGVRMYVCVCVCVRVICVWRMFVCGGGREQFVLVARSAQHFFQCACMPVILLCGAYS